MLKGSVQEMEAAQTTEDAVNQSMDKLKAREIRATEDTLAMTTEVVDTNHQKSFISGGIGRATREIMTSISKDDNVREALESTQFEWRLVARWSKQSPV